MNLKLQAVKWFRRSANQRVAGAQFELSGMYCKGMGVKRDVVQAHMWANLATAQGMTGAVTREIEMASAARITAEEQMTPAQILEAQKMAREWKPKPERPASGNWKSSNRSGS
jgi:TPR repeat protein